MRKLLVLPGDGIGVETVAEALKVLDHLVRSHGLQVAVSHGAIGGAAYEKYGHPLPEATLQAAQDHGAVLIGAVGGPQWDNVERDKRPEAALLGIRKSLDLFANLRPALVFPQLVNASSLKPELISGLDILIVRELVGGVYFGKPRGRFKDEHGQDYAVDTQSYTRAQIERILHVAFNLAAKRSGKVHSVDKANVMESGKFWRDIADQCHKDYPGIALAHMYADNCAMQLVARPKQFDVIVTDNLFGDLLSDCAAMLTGSLGMLPSASFSAPDDRGHFKALYEPVHGTAPDIAGRNQANPLACILSLAMLFEYSWNRQDLSKQIRNAVMQVLQSGLRTADMAQAGSTIVSCSAMGDAVVDALHQQHAEAQASA